MNSPLLLSCACVHGPPCFSIVTPLWLQKGDPGLSDLAPSLFHSPRISHWFGRVSWRHQNEIPPEQNINTTLSWSEGSWRPYYQRVVLQPREYSRLKGQKPEILVLSITLLSRWLFTSPKRLWWISSLGLWFCFWKMISEVEWPFKFPQFFVIQNSYKVLNYWGIPFQAFGKMIQELWLNFYVIADMRVLTDPWKKYTTDSKLHRRQNLLRPYSLVSKEVQIMVDTQQHTRWLNEQGIIFEWSC